MENVRGMSKKRNNLPKNRKKAWKKVNVEEVDDFLEDERLRERTGGKIEEKKDEALYTLDTKKSKKKQTETRGQKKKVAQGLLIEVEKVSKSYSPAKKLNGAKVPRERKAKTKISQTFKEAQQQSKESKIHNRKRARERPQKSTVDYDLWAEDSKLNSNISNEDPHYLDVTKKRRVNLPKHHSLKPSLVPAVEIPHPGASYNPAYDEHEDLLFEANEKEEKKHRLEQRIHRALYDHFPTEQDAPTEASKFKEMSAGLFDEENDEDDIKEEPVDECQNLENLSASLFSIKQKKKDEKTRKNEKLQKEMGKKLKEEKAKRIRENEIFRLKTIKKEIRENERKMEYKRRQKMREKLQLPYTTKRLGNEKFVEPDLEVKLRSELVGSLREMKPEGDLLVDRLKSLQKRNIIEPRVKQKRKKNRLIKYVEKRKHRDIKS